MTELSLDGKVIALERALTAASIQHAFGGALALAYYAEPRATIDVDINIFAPAQRQPEVAAALLPIGVNTNSHGTDVGRDGQERWWWGRNPIDLFYSYDPFHDAMQAAVRSVAFGDRQIPIISGEHLVICKALFDRPKDWVDIQAIVEGTGTLDRAEILAWMARMVGAGDENAVRLASVLASTDGLPGRTGG